MRPGRSESFGKGTSLNFGLGHDQSVLFYSIKDYCSCQTYNRSPERATLVQPAFRPEKRNSLNTLLTLRVASRHGLSKQEHLNCRSWKV